jgi:hypothetical protein
MIISIDAKKHLTESQTLTCHGHSTNQEEETPQPHNQHLSRNNS